MVIIFHNITVYTVFFDQINAALVSRRDFFQKLFFNPTKPKLCTVYEGRLLEQTDSECLLSVLFGVWQY